MDWNSNNWVKQLEEDIFCALNDYVSETKYSYYTDDPSGKTEETKQSALKSGAASQIFHAVSHKEGDKVAEWNGLDLTSATAIMLDIARVYGNEYLDVYLMHQSLI